jgi:hypothetical protein
MGKRTRICLLLVAFVALQVASLAAYFTGHHFVAGALAAYSGIVLAAI